MENSVANQLPEVDSLPDGFVESSPEIVAPVTPLNEKEKPLRDYKENNSVEPDSSNDSSYEASLNEFVSVEGKGEKVPKIRTFPVPLSEKDGYDASGESANVSDDGCLEQREDSFAIRPESSTSASGGSDLRTRSISEKEKGQSEVQSSGKCNYLCFLNFFLSFLVMLLISWGFVDYLICRPRLYDCILVCRICTPYNVTQKIFLLLHMIMKPRF